MQNAELKAIADAIAQLRQQLSTADEETRNDILQELSSLRMMATSVLDDWMTVDEAIEEAIAECANVAESPTDNFSPVDYESLNAAYLAELSAIDAPIDVEEANRTQVDEQAYQATRTQKNTFFTGEIQVPEMWFDMSLKSECALRKGIGYFDLKMYDEAAEALYDAIGQEDKLGTRLYLALSHLGQGKDHLAQYHLAYVKQRATDETTLQAALEVEVQYYAAQENWHQTIRVLYDLLTLAPDHSDVWFNLGIAHLKNDEFVAAERCFAREMTFTPDDYEALFWRAIALGMSGQADSAKTLLAQFTGQDASISPGLWPLKIFALISARMISDARVDAEMLRTTYPLQADGEELLALCNMLEGRLGDASLRLKKVLTIHSDRVFSIALFTMCQFLSGDTVRARRALTWLKDMGVYSPVLQLIDARLDLLSGNLKKAVMSLTPLTEVKGMSLKQLALLYRAITYLELDAPDLARADFGRCRHLGLSARVIEVAQKAVETQKPKVSIQNG